MLWRNMKTLSLKAKMATENYHAITLRESPQPGVKFGDQYIGINDYSDWLPRKEKILVCDSILRVLEGGAVERPNEVDEREDLSFLRHGKEYSPLEAHEEREKEDGMKVFPSRLDPEGLKAVEKLAKKGS